MVFPVPLAFSEVNNNGLGGFEMGAVGAQGQEIGSGDAERPRAKVVPGCLLDWD